MLEAFGVAGSGGGGRVREGGIVNYPDFSTPFNTLV
jgi:hypothetical protein